MTTETPVEEAARAHGLSIYSQREDRIETLLMRSAYGSYSWTVIDFLDAVRRAYEPDRAWCSFYREFLDNLPEDA